MVSLLPAGIAIGAGMIAAAWCLVQAGTIGASAEVEGKSEAWSGALGGFGGFLMIVNLLFLIIITLGGEGNMIPESAWPLLTGAITMIGSLFAAALCIMIGAKMGLEAITEKPELSIWALLFIALGEGLAIYGLIITIMMTAA